MFITSRNLYCSEIWEGVSWLDLAQDFSRFYSQVLARYAVILRLDGAGRFSSRIVHSHDWQVCTSCGKYAMIPWHMDCFIDLLGYPDRSLGVHRSECSKREQDKSSNKMSWMFSTWKSRAIMFTMYYYKLHRQGLYSVRKKLTIHECDYQAKGIIWSFKKYLQI